MDIASTRASPGRNIEGGSERIPSEKIDLWIFLWDWF